ncbi:MAG TPA: hypothetical protein VIQ31_35355, partial [Phormidium sp.]
VETYMMAAGIDFTPTESLTLENESRLVKCEADKSYELGTDRERPDLALEVVVTSGGIDKLEAYKLTNGCKSLKSGFGKTADCLCMLSDNKHTKRLRVPNCSQSSILVYSSGVLICRVMLRQLRNSKGRSLSILPTGI